MISVLLNFLCKEYLYADTISFYIFKSINKIYYKNNFLLEYPKQMNTTFVSFINIKKATDMVAYIFDCDFI